MQEVTLSHSKLFQTQCSVGLALKSRASDVEVFDFLHRD